MARKRKGGQGGSGGNGAPPELEFLEFATGLDFDPELARKCYRHYKRRGWQFPNGQGIEKKHWLRILENWERNSENWNPDRDDRDQ